MYGRHAQPRRFRKGGTRRTEWSRCIGGRNDAVDELHRGVLEHSCRLSGRRILDDAAAGRVLRGSLDSRLGEGEAIGQAHMSV